MYSEMNYLTEYENSRDGFDSGADSGAESDSGPDSGSSSTSWTHTGPVTQLLSIFCNCLPHVIAGVHEFSLSCFTISTHVSTS